MGEIVVRVPKELEGLLPPEALRRIELEVVKEIEVRIKEAQEFLQLAQKSKLDEEGSEELADSIKERLVERYRV